MSPVNYFLSFAEGVLTFVSPCILPLIPVYLFYLAGTDAGQDNSIKINKNRLLINSISFVAGFTLVFILMGATATALGSFLKDHEALFRKISGIIMIIFGLGFIGVLNIKLLNVEKRFNVEFKKAGFFNSIIFGIVFAFGWTPCVGYLLSSALLMAGNSDTLTQGLLLLFAYSMGLGLPFIISAILFESVRKSINSIKKYNRGISIISGIFLVIAGVLAYTDNLKYLSIWFNF